MNCPSCGALNDANSRFCLRCGTPLSVPTAVDTPPQTGPSFPVAPPAGAPPAQPVPTAPAPNPALSGPQPTYMAGAPAPSSGAPTYGANAPFGSSGTTALNIWGPFAGYGTRRRHTGWLLNNEGHRAPELQAAVDRGFRERQIPGTTVSAQTLQAQGVVVETRPYFILRRGLVSLALYIAQFGKDLFISQVAYLKPPISNLRAILVGVMVVFWLWMTFAFSSAVMSELTGLSSGLGLFGSSRASDPGGLINLLCVVGPLGIINNLLLFVLGIFSVYKWMTEKDVLAALRVPPNEFNEDDLMAMEKAVEETVRSGLTAIKVDPDTMVKVNDSGSRFF